MLVRLWNEQADDYNQWPDLCLDEMLDFSAAVERERCADIAKGAWRLQNSGDKFADGWCAAALQIEQAIRMVGQIGRAHV